ncbi:MULTISPECIES: hypothetical protein [Pseudomonas]|uniref:Uncharacterized protein n=1 Tax=Pseudomonas juntendi TaxID=2666183 RepID=A0ABD4YC62_9PSED|nr:MULTISPECIES: hypothetical protein [Pseudomonas]EGB99561.1 hypothetical protein G1E_07788 [Pseudomonas sp. TJI-51]MBA6121653.1 hypothetical protein [Pseudomonas juntendi]MBR7523110.1 hypothetical protein [Pseudomonas juntendi]MCF3155398.1 hypothetical protein [Pseudomonas juntendi]MCI0911098.1 hypothetical protein [Pseudomonas putida]
MLKRLMAKVFPQTTASAVSDLERTLEKLSQAEACHSEAARQARQTACDLHDHADMQYALADRASMIHSRISKLLD